MRKLALLFTATITVGMVQAQDVPNGEKPKSDLMRRFQEWMNNNGNAQLPNINTIPDSSTVVIVPENGMPVIKPDIRNIVPIPNGFNLKKAHVPVRMPNAWDTTRKAPFGK